MNVKQRIYLFLSRISAFFVSGLFMASITVNSFADDPKYSVKEVRFSNFKSYPKYGLGPDVVRDIVQEFVKKNPRATLDQYYQLADQLTMVYRDHGLLFHQVTLHNEQNELKMIMVPGKLQDVHVRKNKRYRDSQLELYLKERIGRVVQADEIELAISRINDLPGVDVFSFFSVGSEPGDARLNVRVKEEDRLQVQLLTDDLGSEGSGVNRNNFGLTAFNPFRMRDELSVWAGATNISGNETLSFDYRIPFGKNWLLSFGHDQQDTKVVFTKQANSDNPQSEASELALRGESSDSSIGLEYSWLRNQWNKSLFGLSYQQRQDQLTTDASSDEVGDELFRLLGLEADANYTSTDLFHQFSLVQPASRQVITLFTGITQGQVQEFNGNYEQQDWTKSNLTFLMRKAFQSLGSTFLDFSFSYKQQWASAENEQKAFKNVLPSYQRMALSGPEAVAGFQSNQANVSEGQHLRFMLSPIQFSLFQNWKYRAEFQFDWASGKQGLDKYELSSFAIVNRINHDNIRLQLGYGIPNEDEKPELGEENLTWFSLSLRGAF